MGQFYSRQLCLNFRIEFTVIGDSIGCHQRWLGLPNRKFAKTGLKILQWIGDFRSQAVGGIGDALRSLAILICP